MAREQTEIEGDALATLQDAEVPPWLPGNSALLARGLRYVLVYVRGLQAPAVLRENDNAGDPTQPRGEILVRAGQDFAARNEAVFHEISEAIYRRRGGPDIEQEARRLTRAFQAPLPAFVAAFDDLGFALERLSAEFAMPQIEVCRRIGEVTGFAMALVRPGHIERGGPDVLPNDRTLRRIAKAGRSRDCAVVRLTDCKRTVLVACRW